jgi:hypothetical protein
VLLKSRDPERSRSVSPQALPEEDSRKRPLVVFSALIRPPSADAWPPLAGNSATRSGSVFLEDVRLAARLPHLTDPFETRRKEWGRGQAAVAPTETE